MKLLPLDLSLGLTRAQIVYDLTLQTHLLPVSIAKRFC